MTRMLYVARLLMAHSIPAMTSLVRPLPFAPSTRTLISLHAGRNAALVERRHGGRALPVPAIMPATCVPWPNASSTDESPVTKLTFATTLFASARVRRDAGVDDRDADVLARHTSDRADAEQPR